MRSEPSQAHLLWRDGQPYSASFDDIYFSRDSGFDESRHVFLQHNQLPQRWHTLETESFTIAETGFGTGLNFLCAWQAWMQHAPSAARLQFVSIENQPLARHDLAQALDLWPQLQHEREQLLSQYANLCPGWHRLVFEQGRVSLTLIIGDVQQVLPQLRASVDAWFLDGFAPAKNPEMWQPALFSQMARLSHASSSFATFTSAGIVRRGLQDAGFAVKKVAGFGRKREMLCGQYLAAGSVATGLTAPSQNQPPANAFSHKHAIVIGSGIAGTATSHVLARRGWRVTLIERHGEIAAEASGNPLAVLYPRLSGQDIALSRLAQHGYLHALRLLQQLQLPANVHNSCGMLQLAFNSKEALRCAAVIARGLPAELVRWVEAAEASDLAGIALAHGGLYFPSAGWVNPPAVCRTLADHPSIDIKTGNHALTLQRHGDLWQVSDAHNLLAAAPVVVIAAANASAGFSQTAHLPLEAVRGQISFIEQSVASEKLRVVVCTDGYVSPAINGVHCVGATFTPEDASTDIKQHDHLSNLALLKSVSPALYAAAQQQATQGRVAFRCTTPDYLPVAGPVLDHVALIAKPPRPGADPASLPWLHGLYVNAGHGSKGFINAPFCAELLASAICGEPLPADAKLAAALDANRFLLRRMGLKRLVQGLAAYPLL